MAEIALQLRRALERRRVLGEPGRATARVLASGEGWTAADVVCTSGPDDRPFEERHARYSISIVLAGSFQYRSRSGRVVMSPGSLMLGNPGQCYECGHEHGEGDRCVSFSYTPAYFERLAADAGRRGRSVDFAALRVSPVRALTPVVAAAGAGVLSSSPMSWEELGMELAARAVQLAAGIPPAYRVPATAEARVTRTIRLIDRDPDEALTLAALAQEAGLSAYHFLRTFRRVTGVSPHQYVMRARLREAAMCLAAKGGDAAITEAAASMPPGCHRPPATAEVAARMPPGGQRPPARTILVLALDCGFGDVSNFNRAFRSEFGVSPREYARHAAPAGARR